MKSYTASEIAIRPATLQDAESLAILMTQLGYLTPTHEMEERLKNIMEQETYTTFVAEAYTSTKGRRYDWSFVGFFL